MARVPLTGTESDEELIDAMSDGIIGACVVVIALVNSSNASTLYDLDKMNIRGSQLWVGYKYYCHEDLPQFIGAVERRDPKMIKMINEMVGDYRGAGLAHPPVIPSRR